MTAKQARKLAAELAEEFKGNTTPYARGYRAALRELCTRIQTEEQTK